MTIIKLLPFAFLNHETNGYLKENQSQHFALKGKSKNIYVTNKHINDSCKFKALYLWQDKNELYVTRL